MKKNNKGFMLLETLIVSTFILGTLVFLYIQFSAVQRSYNTSFRYNTITGLYYAKELSEFLKEDGYTQIENKLMNSNYVDITSCLDSSSLCKKIVEKIGAKKILYIGDKIIPLKKELTGNYDTNIFSPELKKFILQLGTAAEDRKRLVIEYNDSTFASVTLGETKEYRITNLIQNSGFEDGTNNWMISGGTATISENKFSGSHSLQTSGSTTNQPVSLIKDHIYYATERLYLTNAYTGTGEFDLYRVGGTITGYPEYGNISFQSLEAKKWNRLSFIFTSDVTYNYNFRAFYFLSSVEAFVDNTMLIDLTETFGAGNEPSKEWCDNRIQYFDGSIKISR